jgi:hypothetical protein
MEMVLQVVQVEVAQQNIDVVLALLAFLVRETLVQMEVLMLVLVVAEAVPVLKV